MNFVDCIDYIEDTLDVQLIDWQKEILQRLYKNKLNLNELCDLIPNLDGPVDDSMYILIKSMMVLTVLKKENKL